MYKYFTVDIFTPTQPANINYVERTRIEAKLNDALTTPGKQIVVFGHSGSGKTSLLRKNLKKFYEDEIILSCTSDTNINQIILNAFDYLNKYYTSEHSNKNKVKISGELKAIYSIIKNELSEESQTKQKRLVPIQLTTQRLAEFIGEAKCCLVLEDFHKVPLKEKRKISQIMKVFMDTSVKYPSTKIIAIGAVGSARDIVKLDPEMRNRVAEIHVPLMSRANLKKIIDNGCTYLSIEIVHNVIEKIINYSSGLASYCHQICLNMCRNKNITQTNESDDIIQIITSDFNAAIRMIIENTEDTLKAKIDKVLRTTRHGKYDMVKIILSTILKYKSDEIDRSKLIEDICENHEIPASKLYTPLKQLTTEKKENILKYDKNSNKYSFTDPIIRTNILLRFSEEEEIVRKSEIDNIGLDPNVIKATYAAIEDIKDEMDESD
jgi:GTPase SAR1 family protein